jgi:hypothetical protein
MSDFLSTTPFHGDRIYPYPDIFRLRGVIFGCKANYVHQVPVVYEIFSVTAHPDIS